MVLEVKLMDVNSKCVLAFLSNHHVPFNSHRCLELKTLQATHRVLEEKPT